MKNDENIDFFLFLIHFFYYYSYVVEWFVKDFTCRGKKINACTKMNNSNEPKLDYLLALRKNGH